MDLGVGLNCRWAIHPIKCLSIACDCFNEGQSGFDQKFFPHHLIPFQELLCLEIGNFYVTRTRSTEIFMALASSTCFVYSITSVLSSSVLFMAYLILYSV